MRGVDRVVPVGSPRRRDDVYLLLPSLPCDEARKYIQPSQGQISPSQQMEGGREGSIILVIFLNIKKNQHFVSI